jgi:hypothetical protein
LEEASSSRADLELRLEAKDLLHAFEVDALVGQFLDATKRREVLIGEPSAIRRWCAEG